MTKRAFDRATDQRFSVGLPVGIIVFCMLGISAYLVVLGVEIPPPATKVYLASDVNGNP
ncbi:hypothetical protein [Sinorhizobium sp. RAC02]|uniref:hypothetical protein n=1 Tax=Sinorhizobium sp. RAC02 TaxID=1842534 RepID=UPI0008580554|nr:hypothetical protein [Sinorhizobium sp. RAC02]AOF92744.1 hypothetical protein BSY16_4214 [Sinorhizobium sp. RAC02]